jgi:hypothetical protein
MSSPSLVDRFYGSTVFKTTEVRGRWQDNVAAKCFKCTQQVQKPRLIAKFAVSSKQTSNSKGLDV